MTAVKAELIKTLCAVCETDGFDQVLYPANFDLSSLTFEVFSARRMPDRRHYKIIRCKNCGLVRSNPILEEIALQELYKGSHFTYGEESLFAAETYALYLKKVLKLISEKNLRLLEIGCGNGFFLKKAKALGIDVTGVEPSIEAVERAEELKGNIRVGMFEEGIFQENSFDIICAFQMFDHVSQPNAFLKQCRNYLKNNGLAFFIQHDISSVPAKILGESCPMVDIEHTYLYDPSTIQKIFEKNGFEVVQVFSVVNRYPLSYWFKLAPLPKSIKMPLLNFISNSWTGKIPLAFRLGNMGIIARAIKS